MRPILLPVLPSIAVAVLASACATSSEADPQDDGAWRMEHFFGEAQ